jgi:F-type H+-transporting ATPase subunit delta
MTSRAIARQYALALFDVAQKGGQSDRIGRDIAEFAALVRSHEELSGVLSNSAIPVARKRAIVDELVRAQPELSPEVGRLLQFLADRDRLMHLDAIAAAFKAKSMDADRVVRAELVTATPIDEPARGQIAAALGKTLGRQVAMTERVEPSIVGGFVARVGSVVFDGSVARHLERIRERLLREA